MAVPPLFFYTRGMKHLTIIRHAQAESDSPSGADIDRSLTGRGTKDALRLGVRLKERDIGPDLILTSEAVRAQETAESICTNLGCGHRMIRIERRLHHAQASDIIGMIRLIPNRIERVFLVGHNPTVTQALNRFCPGASDGMRAGTAAGLTFEDDTWMAIAFGGGTLQYYMEPEA